MTYATREHRLWLLTRSTRILRMSQTKGFDRVDRPKERVSGQLDTEVFAKRFRRTAERSQRQAGVRLMS